MSKPKTAPLLLKKVFREVRSNWKQFLSMLGIGAIAVTLFVGLLGNAEGISRRVDEAYALGNAADIYVTVSNVEEDDMDGIQKAIDAVGEGSYVEGRFYYTARLDGINSYLVSSAKIPTISAPYDITTDWDVSSIEEPFFGSDYFLMVDQALTYSSAATELTLGIGMDVPIALALPDYPILDEVKEVFSQYLKEGGTDVLSQSELVLTAKINATMSYPENVTRASYNRSAFLISDSYLVACIYRLLEQNYDIANRNLLRQLGEIVGLVGDTIDFEGLSLPYQYTVKVGEGVDVDRVYSAIDDYYAAKGEDSNLALLSYRSGMPFAMTLDMEVSNAVSLTYVIPFLFFFVAVLVILTTTSQIILKERTSIGAMAAMGISKRAIYGHYMAMVGGVVFLSTLIGEILGPIIIPFVMEQKYSILYSLPAASLFEYPVLAGILTFVVFIGIAMLVTYLVARKTVKELPAYSLRPVIPHIKGIRNGYRGKPSARLLSARIAMRNIRTSLLRSLMVVIGVTGCTALLVSGFGIDDTLNNGIDRDLYYYYNSDIDASFALPTPKSTMEEDFGDIEGIEGFSGMSVNSVEAHNADGDRYQTRLYVYDTTQDFVREEIEQGSVGITTKVSRYLNVEVGDEISFEYGGNEYTATISTMFESFSANGIYVDETFPGLLSEGEEMTYSAVFIRLNEGLSEKEFKRYLVSLKIPNVSSYTTYDERTTKIEEIVSGIRIMTLAVKVFAVLLAVVVLYNLALLNFRERTRDIATLKVLGFSRREIAFSLLLETMLLTALGVIVGMCLGSPFMHLILGVNEVALVEFLYAVTPLTYVISFALTFVLAFLVNFYLSFLTRKVKMVESLKMVE